MYISITEGHYRHCVNSASLNANSFFYFEVRSVTAGNGAQARANKHLSMCDIAADEQSFFFVTVLTRYMVCIIISSLFQTSLLRSPFESFYGVSALHTYGHFSARTPGVADFTVN